MSRLWDKGAPLDERVLAFTAGEDHALDERLVAYDARASIAHAQMLNAQGLLSDADCEAIEQGLESLAATHAQGEWRIALEDEDGQTALEGQALQIGHLIGVETHRFFQHQMFAGFQCSPRQGIARGGGCGRRAGGRGGVLQDCSPREGWRPGCCG